MELSLTQRSDMR